MSDDPGIRDALADFYAHHAREERRFYARSPKPIGKVIAQLVARRGYAQVQAAGEREAAWRAAVGDAVAGSTEVAALKRGTFEVLVSNSLVMQELSFRKEELLASLQRALPDAGVKQIRFKVGKIGGR